MIQKKSNKLSHRPTGIINACILVFALFLIWFRILKYQFQPVMRVLDPPDLKNFRVSRKVLLNQPERAQSYRVAVESDAQRVTVHNHGHGGRGWALGPALVAYAHDLWFDEQEKINRLPGLDEKIIIVGSGLLAHLHAYALLEKGFTNIELLANTFDHVIAEDAGGLLRPVMARNDHILENIIDKYEKDAFYFYKDIAQGKHKDIHMGARLVPAYFKRQAISGLESYVEAGMMSPAKSVDIDFGNGIQHHDMVVYDDSIFIDAAALLAALRAHLETKNVQFSQKKVEKLEDIQSDWLINAAGLQAKSVLENAGQHRMQYQQLILKKQDQEKDLNYFLWVGLDDVYLRSEQGDIQKFSQAVYYLPKQFGSDASAEMGVSGGCWIEDPTSDNDEAFTKMLENQYSFFYGTQTTSNKQSSTQLLAWANRLGI